MVNYYQKVSVIILVIYFALDLNAKPLDDIIDKLISDYKIEPDAIDVAPKELIEVIYIYINRKLF